MIAEENKANTQLGKRIKRLGIHQLLKEKFTVEEAAKFSYGKKANILKDECQSRGF